MGLFVTKIPKTGVPYYFLDFLPVNFVSSSIHRVHYHFFGFLAGNFISSTYRGNSWHPQSTLPLFWFSQKTVFHLSTCVSIYNLIRQTIVVNYKIHIALVETRNLSQSSKGWNMGNHTMSTEYSAIQQYYWINYASGVCALIFTILLSLDAYKAFKRKAHWLPSESLVLSALIIQLLTFIDNFNLNVNSNDKNLIDWQIDILIVNRLRFNIRRVMICIFISYLLPGVVRSGLRTVWSDIGALALSVLWHMTYEVYFLHKVIKEETASTFNQRLWRYCKSCRMWFTVSYFILFTALVLLVVLLTCAVIAGKSIRNVISQKVPLALSCCSNYPEKQKCHNIENHVLKCWVVNRASQPDYIMARSVFVSFAGLVSTVCFVLLVAIWAWEFSFWLTFNIVGYLIYLVTLIFILIGWIVVLYRWFTAVLYFPRGVQRLFHMEDFWTRSIVDMKNDVDAYSAPGLFREKRKLERAAIESIVVNLITTFRLNALLFITVLWLQKLIVSMSKACWCLSELAFRLIRPFILSQEKNALLCGLNASVPETDEFHHYKEALDIIRMPGEIAYGLWIANLSAFKKAVNNMEKGYEDGKSNFAEFITLMRYKTGTVEDEIPTSLAEEEKHFYKVGKSSRKMRAVSFIHFMMYFYDETNYKVIDDSSKAYSQAQCFMDIVDSLDLDGHLVSLTADKEFDTLMKIWSSVNPSNKDLSNKLLEEKIKSPLKQLMEQCDEEERTANIEDSRDWMAVAAKISLRKAWKTMDPYKSSSVTAIDHLRSLLANLIDHCMEKELDAAVINNCSKWVQEGRENQIFDAAFIAGKAKAVREKIQGSPTA